MTQAGANSIHLWTPLPPAVLADLRLWRPLLAVHGIRAGSVGDPRRADQDLEDALALGRIRAMHLAVTGRRSEVEPRAWGGAYVIRNGHVYERTATLWAPALGQLYVLGSGVDAIWPVANATARAPSDMPATATLQAPAAPTGDIDKAGRKQAERPRGRGEHLLRTHLLLYARELHRKGTVDNPVLSLADKMQVHAGVLVRRKKFKGLPVPHIDAIRRWLRDPEVQAWLVDPTDNPPPTTPARRHK